MAKETNSSTCEVPGRVKYIFCQPCLKKEKQINAAKYCQTCDEYQCMDCSTVHVRHSYLNSHILVNVNEAERKVSVDMKGLDKCKQHQKKIEFFCEDEIQLCCSDCALDNLRKCKSVVDIQKIVRISSPNKSTLDVKLHEVKNKAEKVIYNFLFSKEKLDNDNKEIPLKIQKMRDEVIRMFDELEVSVDKNIKSFMSNELAKLKQKQSQNEKYLADITNCLEIVENVYENGTSVEQFILEQKMKEEISLLQTNVDAEYQNLETKTISFDFDKTLQLPPLPISEYVPGQLNVKSILPEASISIAPVETAIQLTPVCSIDIKQSKDEESEPFYIGIDFLPDGRLVAVDNKNKRCLLYNEKLEKLGSYQLSYNPQSVVAVSDDQVMITSDDALKLEILHMSKSNQITLDKTFNVTTKYDSICAKDDEHFVGGTSDHSRPVRIISSSGEETDISLNFPNKIYPYEASACTYLRNSEKLLLTHRYEHTVYIYDIKTNTRVVVKDDRIEEPRSVEVGPNDTILVCSQNRNSIVQISQTGQILSSYKTDMKFPKTICVSRDKSFVAVSNACIGDRKLQKLKISY